MIRRGGCFERGVSGMCKLQMREMILSKGRMYDVEIEINVTETYPWHMTAMINGKRFGFPMKTFPTNAGQAAFVFELLLSRAERREFCESAVENMFVVLPGGKRVRAVDYYVL